MYKNALKEDLIRVVENLDGTVESTDTIVKLKTKIENSSTFESDPDFVKTLIQNCIDERVSRNEREVTLENRKLSSKLQLAQLEKEIELQTAKNKALSLNPAAKVEENSETYIQFAARSTANFQYYCSLRKVNSFESLCDLIISDNLFETLNKETATHIGIREAEDWFRPIDLAKECDIYISSRSGSHKEIPITYGYTQDPFKNRSQNFKTKIKENYPQYLERENKNCFICGDSSHCARDCVKRFKPKESNDHIHNRINVNTLKIESEKQNSDGFEQFQYVNIFVENQPVTALIDSGCQIPVLNSSLIRVQTPSEEIITLSSCFGEQRMVEVKPINLSLDQHSPGISVRTAISPTLTEEIIIHPSVYSEIEKLGHAKSDVLLSESESSLSADYGVSFPNVSVSNVIENSSYDLSHILLWSPWKYRCGQRTVRLADCGSQSQAVFARRRSKSKQKLLDIREKKENARDNIVALHFKYDQARRRFVEWAQNEIAVVPDFHKRILFSDEAHFWLNGYVNKQNCRILSEANPQGYVETPLHSEKLTVWCALWAGGIIGPYFFKNDEGHNELWFQQDGAICHTARATIDLLKDTFGDRLISRFGPVSWPPRSCDLTPLDYFLWGYVKSLVYADKPQTLDHLEDNIRRIIADIRPQLLEKVIENWTSRLDYIRASHGSPMPEIIFKM
ncbi:transposable element Tc3 transposase [Trichonephila clavipes]|nr:transposable element Tc3 transposase [Trichonephila clavipes]